MEVVPGTEGYQRSIEPFIQTSQALSFNVVCSDFLRFIPAPPCRVLDIGAGAGQNSAALAALGHAVTAVEPMIP
ncbi:MAG: class I SAM-dependent methyltransferase, partial [Pseudanabaena sp.]